MKHLWLIIILWPKIVLSRDVVWDAPAVEKEHDPTRYTTPISPFIKGTDVMVPHHFESPDFRVEEPFFLPYYMGWYEEYYRPYRASPHRKTASRWGNNFGADAIACYCCTVYKRLTPLAGCALITTRHILTTATSTHLILKDKYDYPILENLLGAWYDNNFDTYNSSMYATPARIHYHPLWHYPENVNHSHPFSVTFDLAVWALTYTVYGYYRNGNSAYVCLRATSHAHDHKAPTPPTFEEFLIVGFQFMWAFKRKPSPFHKYVVMTDQYLPLCPKMEWGWFICMYGDWAKYGIEGGGALHRSCRGRFWAHDGLIGLGAFSMRLRSERLVHYFTVIDNHKVLDFLWDSYESKLQYVWLDKRFNDTKHAAPKLKPNYYLDVKYRFGEEKFRNIYTE